MRLFGRELVAGRGLEVRAQEAEQGPAEILIYDVIGEYYDWAVQEVRGIDARKILAAIADLRGRDLVVRINSPGGLVTEGVAIYNALRRHQGDGAKVMTAIDAQANSIASVIAMAGDPIEMAENATMMIHAAAVFAWGNARDLRQLAEALDRIDSSLIATYVRRTGQDEKQIRAWMDAETWMTAAEALDRGFVDQVMDGSDVVASAKLSSGDIRALRAQDLAALQVDGAAEALEADRQAAEQTAARARLAQRVARLRVLRADSGS